MIYSLCGIWCFLMKFISICLLYMSYLLNQYSNCNWTASGELECPNQKNGKRTSYDPEELYHHVEEISKPMSDAYSGLNRELDISVYTPRMTHPRQDFTFSQRKMSNFQHTENFCSGINKRQTKTPSSWTTNLDETNKIIKPLIPESSKQEAKPSVGMTSQIMWSRSPNLKKIHKSYNMYYFQTPFQKYYDIVNEIGQPTLINPLSKGMAIWQNPGASRKEYNIFKRIDIIDELCFNKYPYPHIGFLYTYVKLKIPVKNLNKVLSISGDVMYDVNKHILIVSGMSLNYNIALIALICMYVSGQISWYNICGNDLIRKMTHHKRLTNLKNQQQNMKILHTYLK